MVLGIVIVAASQVVAGELTSLAGFGDLVRPQIMRALGLSFIFIPVSVMALSDLGPAQQPGSSTVKAVRRAYALVGEDPGPLASCAHCTGIDVVESKLYYMV
jgi:hypothetical protein